MEGNGTEKGSETGDRASLALPLPPPPPPPAPLSLRGTRSFFTFKNHDDAHFSDS